MTQPQVADDKYFKINYPKEMGDTLTLKIKAGTNTSLNFKIENRVGFALRAQVSREVQNVAIAKWFSGSAIQDIPLGISETVDYPLEITVPAEASAGNYSFILEIVDLALPDENIARSLPLNLEVEAARQAIPAWLLILGAVLVLLVVGGGIAAFVLPRLGEEGQIYIAYIQNLPPNSLHLRLPIPRSDNSDDSTSNSIRLTAPQQYQQFLDEKASIQAVSEYQPAWSPDSCSIVYGASLEVGRYFLEEGETLYDLRSFLSIPSETMDALAASILNYAPLEEFLAANPAYAQAALQADKNLYLALAPQNTALVSYYQQTLGDISPDFGAQFYRRVADFVYDELSRGTLYGLFVLDLRQPLDSPERIRLISWSRLDGNARYIPANPTWESFGDSDWIAFEFTQDNQRADQPVYLALYNFGENISESLFLLQSDELRASNGLFYEREPQFWQNGDEFGLIFVSRRNLGFNGQRQAQLYRVTLSLESLQTSGSRLSPLAGIVVADINPSSLATFTPSPTPDADSTATATPIPSPFPTATLFALPLQVTRIIETATPNAELTAELLPTALPTIRPFANLGISNLENLSANSVNDTSPLVVSNQQIIFVSDRDGVAPNESQHLYLLDLSSPQSPQIRRLTNSDNNVLELQPSIEGGAGDNLIFVRQTGRAPQLYTLDWKDSDSPSRLTESNSQLDTFPAWQPDACFDAILPSSTLEGGQ